jgi:hypothetical protein
MEWMMERSLDWLSCHDIPAKFDEDWFRRSKVGRGDSQTEIHIYYGDFISLILFFSKYFFFKINVKIFTKFLFDMQT